ncbi:MAG: hypothetical protein J0H10_15250 [Alphaproteobacteria bacterium]|nr:hypothetical protein [Alphaproteobacteria bacterium]
MGYETAFSIVLACEEAGLSITTAQIAAYARKGFLPHGKRIGRESGKGSCFCYPVGAAKQVLAIAYWQKRYGKNLGAIRWSLWIHGFGISQQYWHPILQDAVRSIRDVRFQLGGDGKVSGWEPHIEARQQKFLKNLMAARRMPGKLGMASRRKSDDFQTLVELCLSVITGEYESIFENATDKKSIEKSEAALNLGFNATKSLEGSDSRFALTNFRTNEIDCEFRKIAKFPRRIDLNWLRSIKPDEILSARNELFSIVMALSEIENAGTSRNRANSSLSVLLNIVTCRQQKAEAVMLVIWLLLRSDAAFRKSASELSRQSIEALHRWGNGNA